MRKNETPNDLLTAATELLGAGLAGTITHTFRCMEIAEAEIERRGPPRSGPRGARLRGGLEDPAGAPLDARSHDLDPTAGP